MEIQRIDHLVLTVKCIDDTVKFYTAVMGFKCVTFGDNRKALTFGDQKINLHQQGKEIEPKAAHPTCGSGDLCFITTTDLETVFGELESKGIVIEAGIVERTGALGKISSIYFRDPDKNLIEVSRYIP